MQNLCGSLCPAGVRQINDVLREHLATGNVRISVRQPKGDQEPLYVSKGQLKQAQSLIVELAEKHPMSSVDITYEPITKEQEMPVTQTVSE
jgi:hypothetical protein